MPTLADLRGGVYRDLADESQAVFSTLQVEDFIRGGIAELNRVAPTEAYDDLALVTDPDTSAITLFTYPTIIQLPYKVEVVRNSDGYVAADLTDPVDGYVNPIGGYYFRRTVDGGVIEFPAWWLGQFDALSFAIRVRGYAARPMPVSVDETVNPSPDVPLSSEEEYSVRGYAKSAGFDLLSHDRGLFAQWQVQTSNSDVSPTQMMQMALNAKGDWDRQRSLIRVVRRYW